jgi:hypothetical protein
MHAIALHDFVTSRHANCFFELAKSWNSRGTTAADYDLDKQVLETIA